MFVSCEVDSFSATVDTFNLTGRQNSQLLGYKFRRQHGVGKFVMDFYCPELKLVIEIDGPTHETELGRKHDFQRQQFVESLGIRFLRFTDDEVRLDVDGVVKRIRCWIEDHR